VKRSPNGTDSVLVAVHFPDLALTYDAELIIDSKGEHWRLSTDSHHNHISRTFTLRTRLQRGDDVLTGRFIVSEDLLSGLEEDEDLRVLAIGEIKKYLDRKQVRSGFIFDLPYKLLS
jgi:hypothetical protein